MTEDKKISAEHVAAYGTATILVGDQEKPLYPKMHANMGSVAHAIWQSDESFEKNFSHFLDVSKAKKLSEQDRFCMYQVLFYIDGQLSPLYFAKRPSEFIPQEKDIKFVLSAAYHLLSANEDLQREEGHLKGGAFTKVLIAKTLHSLGLGDPLPEQEVFNEQLSAQLHRMLGEVIVYEKTMKERHGK